MCSLYGNKCYVRYISFEVMLKLHEKIRNSNKNKNNKNILIVWWKFFTLPIQINIYKVLRVVKTKYQNVSWCVGTKHPGIEINNNITGNCAKNSSLKNCSLKRELKCMSFWVSPNVQTQSKVPKYMCLKTVCKNSRKLITLMIIFKFLVFCC